MNFAQNTNVIQKNMVNVVGTVYVPPALCLLPACASAHLPAYVEPTGVAVTNKLDGVGSVRPATVNGLILFLGLIS